MPAKKKRVVSGIQTSGDLHIGNYIGALQPFLELQDEFESYFFLADLHSVTVPQDPEQLRRQIKNVANIYLACGLDPKKAVLFRQSDVPGHSELGWLLNCIAHMGELSRMTQFKDKTSKQKEGSIGVGLFDYPVLQTADVLLYQAEFVPVGEDQKQHIELMRDLAQRFNHRFGETFVVPKPLIKKEGALIMGLDDPAKKMAKSAETEFNRINIVDSPTEVRKKIARAVTDSGDDIKSGSEKPALTNLLTIYSQLEIKSVKEIESYYQSKSYKEFKEGLVDVVIATLEPIQKKLKEFEANPDYVESVLQDGAKQARKVAEKTLVAAQTAMGL